MLPFVILCALSCAALVAFERAGSPAGIPLCKTLASSAFVGAALAAGAPTSRYGSLILIALTLSWLGDVLLIARRHRAMLLAGMASFLLAHLAYCLAFGFSGPDLRTVVIAAPIVGAAAYLVFRWLSPHVSGVFRLAVPAYMIALAAMVVLATSVTGKPFGWAAAVGALLFGVSDVIVARDRFVQTHWRNRAVGLPLYYAAQLLLASTVPH